jgi:hypothetical protein
MTTTPASLVIFLKYLLSTLPVQSVGCVEFRAILPSTVAAMSKITSIQESFSLFSGSADTFQAPLYGPFFCLASQTSH